ncbi:MAG TPA: hypothetical protein VGB94_01195, partial [Acidobacteriaceae bacterium]
MQLSDVDKMSVADKSFSGVETITRLSLGSSSNAVQSTLRKSCFKVGYTMKSNALYRNAIANVSHL